MEISQRVGIGSTKAESWAYGTPFALLFAFIIGAIAKSVLIGSVSMVGLTALLVPLVFYLDTQWREKKHDKLVEVADELQQIVMQNAGEVRVPATTASTAERTPEAMSESKPGIELTDADETSDSHNTGSQRLQDRS